MINQGSETLRELIRILVRDLGILQKSDASCCGVTITQCHAVVEIGRKGKISLVDLAGLLGATNVAKRFKLLEKLIQEVIFYGKEYSE